MKLGIMQPYYLPYIGYWQLLNAVDKYVIYDDVNYIKGGWINRNRVLINGQPSYFNVPLKGASSFKLINEIEVNNDPILIKKNLHTIEDAYKKAPYFNDIYPLVEKIVTYNEMCLAKYLEYSIKVICQYLDINTELIVSSSIEKDNSLKGKDKVIEICKILNADEYYNAVGGQDLYSFEEFAENGIKLSFVETEDIVYKQFKDDFQPNLSILDVMMFNSKEDVKKLLHKYKTITKE